MPKLKWRPSVNIKKGRIPEDGTAEVAADWIVLHYTSAPTFSSAFHTLTEKPSDPEENPASAHFLISREGDINWLVRLKDTAFHAGIDPLKGPSVGRTVAEMSERKRRLTTNERSIGIELQAESGEEGFTEAQYTALRWLLPILAFKYKIPLRLPSDPTYGLDENKNEAYDTAYLEIYTGILSHGNIHYGKPDPGLNFKFWQISNLTMSSLFGRSSTAFWAIIYDAPSLLGSEGEDYLPGAPPPKTDTMERILNLYK